MESIWHTTNVDDKCGDEKRVNHPPSPSLVEFLDLREQVIEEGLFHGARKIKRDSQGQFPVSKVGATIRVPISDVDHRNVDNQCVG